MQNNNEGDIDYLQWKTNLVFHRERQKIKKKPGGLRTQQRCIIVIFLSKQKRKQLLGSSSFLTHAQEIGVKIRKTSVVLFIYVHICFFFSI